MAQWVKFPDGFMAKLVASRRELGSTAWPARKTIFGHQWNLETLPSGGKSENRKIDDSARIRADMQNELQNSRVLAGDLFFRMLAAPKLFWKTELWNNRMMYGARWRRALYLVVNGNDPLTVKVKYVSIIHRVRLHSKDLGIDGRQVAAEADLHKDPPGNYEKYCCRHRRHGKLMMRNSW